MGKARTKRRSRNSVKRRSRNISKKCSLRRCSNKNKRKRSKSKVMRGGEERMWDEKTLIDNINRKYRNCYTGSRWAGIESHETQAERKRNCDFITESCNILTNNDTTHPMKNTCDEHIKNEKEQKEIDDKKFEEAHAAYNAKIAAEKAT